MQEYYKQHSGVLKSYFVSPPNDTIIVDIYRYTIDILSTTIDILSTTIDYFGQELGCIPVGW
jgi:hypothetical protein